MKRFQQAWRTEEGSVLSNISFPPFSTRESHVPLLFRNGNDSMSDHRINSMTVGVGSRTDKTIRLEHQRHSWLLRNLRCAAGRGDFIYMAWLGKMQSGKQRHSSSWKKECCWGKCQGPYGPRAAWATRCSQDMILAKGETASSESRNWAYLKQAHGKDNGQ